MRTKSRREFLRMVAAGSAAVVAASAGRAAAAAKSAAAKSAGGAQTAKSGAAQPGGSRSAAVQAEIDKQKKSTAKALKAIRAYELPAGSPMAFAFRPLRPTHKGGR